MSVNDGPRRAASWNLVDRRTALLAVAASVVLTGLAISPPVGDQAEEHALVHYSQHAVVFIGGMLMGGALRELVQARPMRVAFALVLGAVSFVGDIATLLPPFDDAIEENATLHDTQHGLVFLAGALMAVALRDLVLRGLGPRRAR
jgi:hypothetical protein